MRLIDLLNVIEGYEEVEIWLHGEITSKIYDIDTAIGAIKQLEIVHDCIVIGVESYPGWYEGSYISIDIKEEGF